MNTSYRLPSSLFEATGIREIVDAAAAVDAAKRSPGRDALVAAKDDLRAAILSGRDQGLSWQAIGDALGVRRGCAYQRFRRRSGDSGVTEISRTSPRPHRR